MLVSVLLMPLAETIMELISFTLKGVDLIDHASIFLLRTTNHCVIVHTQYKNYAVIDSA